MFRILLWAIWISSFLLPGAERWEMQYFYDKNDSTLSLIDLQFPPPARGIAIGAVLDERRRKPVAVLTADGGAHWELLPLKEFGLTLFFLNERTGWMVDQKGGL